MRRVFIAIGLVLLVLFIISIQSMAQQSAIYGCVSKIFGRLRIVDDPSECRPRWETPIFWAMMRFSDLGDGTVRDNNSDRVWLKNANCFFDPMTWVDAMETASALSHGQCGLNDDSLPGDWRLPSKEEWEGFVFPGFREPALCDASGTARWSEGDLFNNVLRGDGYWSSTEHSGTIGNAWNVTMNDGMMRYDDKLTNLYLWPVREDN